MTEDTSARVRNARPILFDITNLASRCQARPHTGIERVDIAFAKALAATNSVPVMGLHCNLLLPHLLPRQTLEELVQKAEAPSLSRNSDDLTKQFIHDWVTGAPQAGGDRTTSKPFYSTMPSFGYRFRRHLRLLVPSWRQFSIPRGAIYLNTAPSGTPGPIYFRWLHRRTDIKAVFFIHDLLLLDHPEFFPPEWHAYYAKTTSAIMERANGIIVASNTVRDRVERELSQHRRKGVKVHVAHLPPCPTFLRRADADVNLRDHPYFVMCGTIEPRKNHRLLLELWRQLSRKENGQSPPKLILIGKRGWRNERVLAMLDHDHSLRSFVLEATGVPDSIQLWLLSNACAALFPTLAEGYGLPLVEALSLGVPTVASAIPVLREVSQGCATFCHPNDLQEWKRAILALSDRSTSDWEAATVQAGRFRPPTINSYFASIMQFLHTL